MPENAKAYAAEFIATFALVFITGAAVLSAPLTGAGILSISLASGLTLVGLIYATWHISGAHINPAVTFGLFLAQKIDVRKAGYYIVAQCMGAVFGAQLLKILFVGMDSAYLGTPMLGAGISFEQGLLMEAVLTFFLVFTIYGTAVDQRATEGSYGLAIGAAVVFCMLAGSAISGASMNPARSFGPALVSGMMDNHLLYWAGPFLGGGLAAMVYRHMLEE